MTPFAVGIVELNDASLPARQGVKVTTQIANINFDDLTFLLKHFLNEPEA